jgi:branched-chain amino acid transport system permease protein
MAPRVGTDEWVAQAEARIERRRGPLAAAQRRIEGTPFGLRFAPVVAVFAVIPFVTESDYVVQVALDTLLFALLAMGLNVVTGWTGLLDLGYIAFFGLGAYGYAAVSSEQFGLHWPTLGALGSVTFACAAAGFLLGLPSRRLVGDYLAIVTLFFGQIFQTVVRSGNTVKVPGKEEPVDFTGGPNGIPGIDPWHFSGLELTTVRHYFYAALSLFGLVAIGLWVLNSSRTGRALRAIREDELAAELLGTPVVRLKLVAFALGAAIAGLSGTIFASVQSGAFPGDFDLPLLITVYAMVILGGAGSLTGVVVGAILINVILEILRTPDQARWVFYGVLVAALVWRLRPRVKLAAVLDGTVARGAAVRGIAGTVAKLAAVLGGTIALGFAIRGIAGAVWDRGTAGEIPEGGALGSVLERWVLLPAEPQTIGNLAFIGLVLAIVVMTQVRSSLRVAMLAPLLYLVVFVWENRLVLEPSITRLILLGGSLVVLMAIRPEGLLGQKRVEIV